MSSGSMSHVSCRGNRQTKGVTLELELELMRRRLEKKAHGRRRADAVIDVTVDMTLHLLQATTRPPCLCRPRT
jgi:hypothetical protein